MATAQETRDEIIKQTPKMIEICKRAISLLKEPGSLVEIQQVIEDDIETPESLRLELKAQKAEAGDDQDCVLRALSSLLRARNAIHPADVREEIRLAEDTLYMHEKCLEAR